MSYQQPQGYAAPQPPVDLNVYGTLVGVEARNKGWMRFLIMEAGKQYPYKADTSDQDVIAAAMSLMNQPVAAQCREQNSDTINPRNNQPYKNRWLNAIAPAGAQQQAQQAPQQAQQAPIQYVPPQYVPSEQQPQQEVARQPFVDEREMQIMRQAASKVVAMSGMYALPTTQHNAKGMVEACEVWMAYYVYGPLRLGVQPFSAPQGQDAAVTAAQAPLQPALEAAAVPGAQVAEGVPCDQCGFTGTHALNCPNEIPF
jgi:hypothetical protein